MALYDKASLVLIPSGTKAGKVYSQKPVPSNDVLSDELVTNGTFDTDSDWSFSNIGGTHGWRIADGRAICDTNASVFNRNMSSNTILEEGKTYILNLDILQSADNISLIVGSSTLSSTLPTGTNLNYSFIFKSPATGIFQLYAGTSDLQEIDNVSVRQVVDGDFDFTRSSYATRVNSQGLIEKERGNLLLQSNSFDEDTNWVNSSTTETSGQSGYDGSSDAWLLTKIGANGRIYQDISSSGVQTFSVYAKANTSNWVSLWTNVGTSYFDLANGIKGSTTSATTIGSEIESVGNGWYRCSLIFNTAITAVRIFVADNDLDVSGTSGSIYIQDAQLEQGLVATDVIETTTSAVYTGITDNVPRLDYDGDCPTLLLEPQRTNLIDYSENFSHASWLKNNATLTSGFLSPDGTKNAFEYVGSGATQDLRKSITVSDNYTYSFHVKAINSPYIRLRTIDGSCWFNMTTNTVATNTFASAEIKNAGNGWYRLSVTSSSFTANNTLYIHPHAIDNTTTELDGGEFLIYGSQLEQGSYATSYIPTYGTSVTRNADLCNNAGDSTIFNDEEGVLFVEMAALDDDLTNRQITISDGSSTNRVYLGLRTQSNQVIGSSVSGGVENFINHTLSDTTTNFKLAFKYKQNDLSLFLNGTQVGFDNTANTPIGLNELSFDNGGGTQNFYGKCKAVAYFNRALTDTELADLTT